MKVLITERFSLPEDAQERFANMGLEADFLDKDTVIDPSIYDVVYGQHPFKVYPYERFTNLKFLQLSCAGIDHLDTSRWLKDGLLISNATGVYSAPIAEYIVLSILMSYKKTLIFSDQQHASTWKKQPLRELGLQKILFLGTGDIAKEAAKRLQPFGCWLIGLNRDGHAVVPFSLTGKLSKLKEYLASADVVVNALPLTIDTTHLFDQGCFDAMKPGCTFINIGRGKTVDEKALIKALESDQLSFTHLDVFEEEPLSADSPLWHHPKVFITPHNTNSGQLMPERNYSLFINNLQHYLRREPLENAL